MLVMGLAFAACTHTPTPDEAYLTVQEKIKQSYEKELGDLSFPWQDYKHDDIKDNTFLIVSYFEWKNTRGGTERYYYKAKIKYESGRWTDPDNWNLISFEPYDKSLY